MFKFIGQSAGPTAGSLLVLAGINMIRMNSACAPDARMSGVVYIVFGVSAIVANAFKIMDDISKEITKS